MPGDTTDLFGIAVPSVDPIFLAVVRFHILVGVCCVVVGAIAMLSPKGRGRHSSFGTIYYWSLMVVVATATGLSVVRWADNFHLFFLGTLSLVAATIARTARSCCNCSRLFLALSVRRQAPPGQVRS
jgi:uncharacterized membrane protein